MAKLASIAAALTVLFSITVRSNGAETCSSRACEMASRPKSQGPMMLQFARDLKKSAVSPARASQPTLRSTVPAAPEGSVVSTHGSLSVQGNRIVNQFGEPVRLRGMSLFWSQWMPQFWSAATVKWLKNDWHVTLVRAAMGIESGGYLTHPQTEMARIEAVVDAAIEAGIYVVVDWHDHNAEKHLHEAKAFFVHMAQKYGQYPNVLFETFNEPVRQSWSQVIKPHHESIVEVIREHTDNIVILGTKFWSQAVDHAADNPVEGHNLAYTIHFYANSHRQELRDKVVYALNKGVAIFATEWGTCDASGDGSLDLGETQKWLDFFEEHKISDANWAVGDKREACAALQPGASGNGGWSASELTASGAFVRSSLRESWQPGPTELPPAVSSTTPTAGWQSSTQAPGQCSAVGEDCRNTGCCIDPSLRCFVKNQWYAGCLRSCDPDASPEHGAHWSCEEVESS